MAGNVLSLLLGISFMETAQLQPCFICGSSDTGQQDEQADLSNGHAESGFAACSERDPQDSVNATNIAMEHNVHLPFIARHDPRAIFS